MAASVFCWPVCISISWAGSDFTLVCESESLHIGMCMCVSHTLSVPSSGSCYSDDIILQNVQRFFEFKSFDLLGCADTVWLGISIISDA